MTRTDAIVRAVIELLEARRPELDGASTLRTLTLDLRFAAGHIEPRSIVDRIEREHVRPERAEGIRVVRR